MECKPGWLGLTPLVLNPTFTDVDDIDKLAQGTEGVEWTHFDDMRQVYGTGPDGFARRPWDNVGVQYGLEALRDGTITPAEFLDLNANVGGWKQSAEMVTGGLPVRRRPDRRRTSTRGARGTCTRAPTAATRPPSAPSATGRR